MFSERKDRIPLPSSLSPWGSPDIIWMSGDNVCWCWPLHLSWVEVKMWPVTSAHKCGICLLFYCPFGSWAKGLLGSAPEQKLCLQGTDESLKWYLSTPLQLSSCCACSFPLSFHWALCPHYLCCSFQVHFPPAVLSIFTVFSNDCSC